MELREVKRKSAALQMQQFVGEEKNDLLDYLRSLQPEKNGKCKFAKAVVIWLFDFSVSVLPTVAVSMLCELIAITSPFSSQVSMSYSSIGTSSSHNNGMEDKVVGMKCGLWLTFGLHSARYQVAELSEPTSPELKEIIHSVVHGLLATLSPKMHSKAPPLSENSPTGTVNVGGEDCAELVENTSLQFQPLISLTRDYLARLLFWCMLLGHYLRGLEYRMELMELLSLPSNAENEASGGEQVA
uniref:Uncharacterized protein n=1 Tax=Fagus sylvatica TaxID=28930 RepID=A0A2N9JAF1_FAGSY